MRPGAHGAPDAAGTRWGHARQASQASGAFAPAVCAGIELHAPSARILPVDRGKPGLGQGEPQLIETLRAERDAALAGLRATAEILRVISQSPTDAEPVFDRIVTTAARLLDCDYAYVILTNGVEWRPVAGSTPGGVRAEKLPGSYPVDPDADFPSRTIVTGAVVHLPDWASIDLPPLEQQVRDLLGARSSLYLPFLRDGACVGLLAFVSRRAHAFAPAAIALAEFFRDQAVIAIENTRLFNETREALERQTATGDVLKIISRLSVDLQTVLETLVDSLARLCRADQVYLFQLRHDRWHLIAGYGLAIEVERIL